jgi:FKBP-type peptidyl-prolyl cis-trans isomerase SlyD
MQISQDSIVTMHYTLTAPNGDVIDSSQGREPLAYLHGHGNIIAGLEKQLEGKELGAKLTAEVPATEGYGDRDPNLIVEASRAQFPEDVELKPGMRFQAETPQGPRVAEITEVEGEKVTVDTNHPLAGVDLKFEVEIVEVRKASPEELSHGHVHQKDDCGEGNCGCKS